MFPIVKEIRDLKAQYSGSVCTLDGRPAVVSGRFDTFAIVSTTDCYPTMEREMSWRAVDATMTHLGGRFTTR